MDRLGRIGGAVLAASAVVAYSRTFCCPLVFDDIPTIADNPSLRHWGTALLPPVAGTAGGRPMLNLSLAFNYALSGTAVWSYHILNLAIHILGGLTLFGILRRTLAPRAHPRAESIAFSAALIWILHPLQTESVTYIVQRAESLMGLFYFLTLYAFIRGAERGGRSWGWFALSISACLLGMTTKEVMVTAPLMVLLYDRTFLAGGFRHAFRRRWPVYCGLVGTWMVLILLVYSDHGRNGSAGFGHGVAFASYAATQFPAVLRYLKLSFWPYPLVFYYGTEWVTDFRPILPAAAIIVGLMSATIWGLVRSGVTARSLGFAGAWFFAILAPTSLIPIVLQTAAEHRMYLALAPVAALVTIGIYHWLGSYALPLCLALAAGLGAITFERNENYRSDLNLWADTVAKCPTNAYAHYNLGFTLQNMPGRLPDAIGQYEETLRLKPDFAMAHTNLGHALATVGRTADAVVELTTALRLEPNSAEMHNNLGDALAKIAGRLPDAISEFAEALRLKPDFADAHNNLGNALRAQGRTTEAMREFAEALRLEPGSAEAHYNQGNAFAGLPNRANDAIAEFTEAIRLKPGYAAAHNNLGSVLAAKGRIPEAIAEYQEALGLDANYPEAHSNLGNALTAEGRIGEAVAEFGAALRLAPNSAETHYNLGNGLARMPGRAEDAIAQYRAALQLKADYSEAQINLGSALTSVGRPAEAIAELDAALRLAPNSAEAYNNLGNALMAAGRTNEAIARYEHALRLRPDFADALYNLGNAYEKTPGGSEKAIARYERAVQLQPNFLEAHYNLAAALLRVGGRGAELKLQLEAVLRLQPENEQVRQILAGLATSPP